MPYKKRLFISSLLLFSLFIGLHCNRSKPHNVPSEPQEERLYLYATFGTLPSLYANLHIYTHSYPALIYFERDSYDKAEFPPHVSVDPASGKGNNWPEQQAMHLRTKEKIRNVFAKNPRTQFHLYVDDLRLHILKLWLWDNGIPDEQIKLTLLSDGVGTYILIKNRYAAGFALWQQDKNEFEALKAESIEQPNAGETNFERDKWTHLMHVAAYQNNIEYDLQFPEFLESNQAEIQKMNFIKIDPFDLWKKLSATQKSQYKKMARFSEKDETYYNTIFASENKKPNLIITGTNPSSAKTKNGIDKVLLKYDDQYNYFFKPHPADAQAQSILDQFPVLKKLEGTVPTELLFWFYDKEIAVIGGHESTLYLSVPKGKTQFFFSEKLSVPPLDLMWEKGYFQGASLLGD